MKQYVAPLLVAMVATARGFVPTVPQPAASTALSMTTQQAVDAKPFVKGPRIVLEELPVLYVYDHCPFCVRVRLALGVKNIKHNLYFLANDDVATPTALVGKKIAPIFAIPADKSIMAESLDIIAAVDSDDRLGPAGAILPASGRKDVKAWQKSVRTLLRTLQRPRYVATGLLPEFQQLDCRRAFIANHPLPPYEKSEWRGTAGKDGDPGMDMEVKLGSYAEAMAADPAHMIEDLNARLVELDDMLYSEHHCSKGGFSLDDIDLWARLRSITIVKGVEWPTRLRSYMDNLSALGDVPLYDEMAL